MTMATWRGSLAGSPGWGLVLASAMTSDGEQVLLLLDASRDLSKKDKELQKTCPKNKTLTLWNKTDLKAAPEDADGIPISAKEKQGLEELKRRIDRFIWKNGAPAKDEVLITNLRHFQELEHATQSVEAVVTGLKTGISAEFVAADMRASLHALGSIIGTNVTEDILSAIFRNFCLGK